MNLMIAPHQFAEKLAAVKLGSNILDLWNGVSIWLCADVEVAIVAVVGRPWSSSVTKWSLYADYALIYFGH